MNSEKIIFPHRPEKSSRDPKTTSRLMFGIHSMQPETDGMASSVEVVKEGWLNKRGEHIKNWRKRYFILRSDGSLVGYKNYSESPAQAEPSNNFTVARCQIMTQDNPRQKIFIIRGLQLTTVIERMFSVDTEEERSQWVDAIRYVLKSSSSCEIRENKLAIENSSQGCRQ